MSIDSVVPSNHLILSHPLLLHSIFPIFGVFSNEPALLIRVLELQLQHQFFQRVLRVDFLWIDWFDLLAAQGTLKNLLQHHSLKVSILQRSAFLTVQLSHPYMSTGSLDYVDLCWQSDCFLTHCLGLSLDFFPYRSP